MNPNEQNPSGSQQQKTDQSTTKSTTGGQYNQARQHTSSGAEQSGQYGQGTEGGQSGQYGQGSQYGQRGQQGSQYGQSGGYSSGNRGWQDDSNWMTGKVGLYSALAAGSIGALAYLLVNRDAREKATDFLGEGMETLQGHAQRVTSAFSSGSSDKHGSSEESDWNSMEARDIMTDAPAVCTPDTRLDKIAAIMEDCDCGAVPVVDNKSNRKPIGMVTDRDIVIRGLAEGRNPLEMTARDVMTSDIVSVRHDASLDDVAEKMQDHQVRRVIVTDRNGRCRGIIAQADIARYAPKQETAETVREVSEPSGRGILSGLMR